MERGTGEAGEVQGGELEMIGNDAHTRVRQSDCFESVQQEYAATGSLLLGCTRVVQEGWEEVVLSVLEECVFGRNKMQRDLHTNEGKE